MAGFNAATVVEPLDFDFRTPEHPKAPFGVIKEPNDKQIADYLAGARTLVTEFRGQLPDELIGGNPDMDAVLSAVEGLDTDIQLKFNEQMAEVVAALCSGTPSKTDILGLPPRIRTIFFAWLQREVMSPEAVPGGGN